MKLKMSSNSLFAILLRSPWWISVAIAAFRQWHLPSAARVAKTQQALQTMAWPAFAALLEQAFQRDGYTVQRSQTAAADFELVRQGRRMLVSARR